MGNKYDLSEISLIAQKASDAVAAVLGVDVEIVDTGLMRIAGTGKYRSKVGLSLDREGGAYRQVFRTGKGMVIANPGMDSVCRDCLKWRSCDETAEVSSPILVDGEVVGIIGLLCFDMEQRASLMSRLEPHREFIDRMSELLAAKIRESRLWMESQVTSQVMRMLLDRMDDAVVAVDKVGRLLYFNERAVRLTGISSEKDGEPGAPRDEITKLPGLRFLGEVASSGKGFLQKEMFLNLRGIDRAYMVSASSLGTGDRILGAMATFRPISELHHWAYDLTQSQASLGTDTLVGESQALRDLKVTVGKVANSRSTVLILGESGTGKELLARAIHSAGRRSQKPFVVVNCAAIPDGLLESELFGYNEGAFTGASKNGKPGKFEIADGGTIFLDEIGDMSLYLQAKLLRVLQDGVVERLGATRARICNVRVIAATNQDLERKMARGEFRDDLYYRLNVIPLRISPLRDRSEDIQLLTRHFVARFAERLHKEVSGIDPEVVSKLRLYPWPGNVRELENAIEYAVNFETSSCLTVSSLPERVRAYDKDDSAMDGFSLSNAEAALIKKALQKHGTSYRAKRAVAKELGISLATLYRKMEKYGLSK